MRKIEDLILTMHKYLLEYDFNLSHEIKEQKYKAEKMPLNEYEIVKYIKLLAMKEQFHKIHKDVTTIMRWFE